MLSVLSKLIRGSAINDQILVPLWQAYEAALDWIIMHRLPESGIVVDNRLGKPYPEVTGYIIPTLLDCGETDLAAELTRWLLRIQRIDGGFDGPDEEGESYLFDTGQAMRGLVSQLDAVSEAERGLRRAADWMVGSVADDGVLRPMENSVWYRRYGDHICEDIHLYTLSPLLEAGRKLGVQAYIDCVERSLEYYTRKPDLLRFRYLTHFYGYVLEALVDLGRGDLARRGLEDILNSQRPDGSIPGVPGASWICSPGTAQLAIVGYKLGLLDFGNAALNYLQTLQLPSGGFFGGYGSGATYAPNAELSWASKYFLDACHWRMRATFSSQKERFHAISDATDPRLPAIMSSIGNVDGQRVLDVGCGRGQFLRALQLPFPSAELWGVDVSEELLKSLPSNINTRRATALNLPFANATFDVVLCVEVLEHTIRIERAIDEMCRVLRPGGKLIIIDKNSSRLGRLKLEVWERWFEPDQIVGILRERCDSVTCNNLRTTLDEDSDPTTLHVEWTGQRRDASSGDPPLPLARLEPDQSRRVLDRYAKARREADAHALVESGFRRYWDGDVGTARREFIRAVSLDPYWLRNRGVISILLRSLNPRCSRQRSEPAK